MSTSHEITQNNYEILGAAIHEAVTAHADKAVDAALHLALSEFDVLSGQAALSIEATKRLQAIDHTHGTDVTVAAIDMAHAMNTREVEETAIEAKLRSTEARLGRAARLGMNQHDPKLVTNLQHDKRELRKKLTDIEHQEQSQLATVQKGLHTAVHDTILDDPFDFWRYEAPVDRNHTPASKPVAERPQAVIEPQLTPESTPTPEPVVNPGPEPASEPQASRPESSIEDLRATIHAKRHEKPATDFPEEPQPKETTSQPGIHEVIRRLPWGRTAEQEPQPSPEHQEPVSPSPVIENVPQALQTGDVLPEPVGEELSLDDVEKHLVAGVEVARQQGGEALDQYLHAPETQALFKRAATVFEDQIPDDLERAGAVQEFYERVLSGTSEPEQTPKQSARKRRGRLGSWLGIGAVSALRGEPVDLSAPEEDPDSPDDSDVKPHY